MRRVVVSGCKRGYGVGLWKAIRKVRHIVSSRLSFVVGNGQMVSFWKDTWCGDTPLCASFPSLFALAKPKETWVKDVWNGTIGGEGELEGLLLRLCGQNLILEEEDRMKWMETKDGIFSTKSLYKALESGSSILFPMKNIWISCVRPKVNIFAWEASWAKF